MINFEEVYKIGRLGKPHGVKGELQFCFDDDVFDRVDSDYLIVELDGILVPFFFEQYRFKNDNVALVKFEGIDSEEQARALTNANVFFERQKSDASEEELTWAQIVGFSVYESSEMKRLGVLSAVDDSTENILFEVLTSDGHTYLLPCNENLIDEINPRERSIVMTLPEGLLDL